MVWHDETPWARKRRKTKSDAADALRQVKEQRVDLVRQALASYDRGGCSLDRFLEDIAHAATGGVVRIGEQARPEVHG